jgi:two-component system, OmpR family, response regulator MtrA
MHITGTDRRSEAIRILDPGHDGAVTALGILIVEDDDGIRTALRLALEDEGYRVSEAESGERALEQIATGPADLILVDLMLPGMSGFELVHALRRVSEVPIVIVTARSDSHDVVAGLEAGADDYVRKPFVVKELEARIRALLRRANADPGTGSGGSGESTVHQIGDLEIRPEAGTVLRAGTPISLTRTEFLLLCELVENQGIVLSRERLLERVWGYDYFGDSRLVDAHVRRLRTKIEVDPSNPKIVLTMRGLGYKLNA